MNELETPVNVPVKQLNAIERRLGDVESTLQQVLEQGDKMEESMITELTKVRDGIEANTLSVRRMQRKMMQSKTNSKYLFCAILGGLVIWTLLTNAFRVWSL